MKNSTKYQETKSYSRIGRFEKTFLTFYNQIPADLIQKLSAEELATLIDTCCMYCAYETL